MILFIIIKLSATTLNPLKGEVRLNIHVDVITCNTQSPYHAGLEAS